KYLIAHRLEKLVASLAPGTCRGRLWLLPSGPDQVHQTAMRGGPPPTIVRQRNRASRKRAVSLQSSCEPTLATEVSSSIACPMRDGSTPSVRKPPGVFFSTPPPRRANPGASPAAVAGRAPAGAPAAAQATGR